MNFSEVPISDPFIKIFPATFLTLKLWFRLSRIEGALLLMISLPSEVDVFPLAAQVLKHAHKLGSLMSRKMPLQITFCRKPFLALGAGKLGIFRIMSSADMGGQSLFIHIVLEAGGALIVGDSYVLLLHVEPHPGSCLVGLPTDLAVQIIRIYGLEDVLDILLLVVFAGIHIKF